MPEELIRRKRRLSSFQIITLGFAGVILLGALLLMLPISTTGEEKERIEVYETGIYWDGNHYDVRRDWILRERNGESADRCIAEK